MEGTITRVRVGALPLVIAPFELVTVQRARDAEVLAPHTDNLLAVQKLLGHDGRDTAHKVVLDIDDHQLFKHGCLLLPL